MKFMFAICHNFYICGTWNKCVCFCDGLNEKHHKILQKIKKKKMEKNIYL